MRSFLLKSYHMLIAQTDAEELPTVSVNPYFSFGSITKTVSELKQHLNEYGNEELVKVATTGESGHTLCCERFIFLRHFLCI